MAERDVVVILELNVSQSDAERYPETDAVEVGCEKVKAPDDDVIEIPDAPEVEKDCEDQIVIAPVLPERAMPVPAVVEETKLLPREFCLPANIPKSAAERKPA